MGNKKFKVALVGCGTISPNHLGPLVKNSSVEIVALCDKDISRAAKRAEEFSLDCNLYNSFDKLLEHEELDAVHIATPHYLHAPMTIAALGKNINVFLEKPLCIDEDEIESILEAEKKSGGRVCVCFQNRFNPSTEIAKKLISDDGGAKSAFASVVWGRSDEYYLNSGWRGKYSTEGGGVMINQAIHTLDLLRIILGIPTEVIATTSNHTHKGVIEVEDTAEGIITFEDGGRANFYFTTTSSGADSTSLIFNTKNHKIEIKGNFVFLDDTPVEDERFTANFVGKACYGNSHGALIGAFYEALEKNLPMPVCADDAKWALKILLSSYKSADTLIKIN